MATPAPLRRNGPARSSGVPGSAPDLTGGAAVPVNRALTAVVEARRHLRKAAEAMELAIGRFDSLDVDGREAHHVSADAIEELGRVRIHLLDVQEELRRSVDR
jgi:hypothetical protein